LIEDHLSYISCVSESYVEELLTKMHSSFPDEQAVELVEKQITKQRERRDPEEHQKLV